MFLTPNLLLMILSPYLCKMASISFYMCNKKINDFDLEFCLILLLIVEVEREKMMMKILAMKKKQLLMMMHTLRFMTVYDRV